jgi:hypothetical protein
MMSSGAALIPASRSRSSSTSTVTLIAMSVPPELVSQSLRPPSSSPDLVMRAR